MLKMKPTCTFYLCVKDGDHAKQAASIRLIERNGEWATFSIKDAKADDYRTVSVQDLTSAVVYVHDSDKNYMCYVNWYAETDDICFDVSKDDVHIHRYKQMAESGFRPVWDYVKGES
jgi:hypothetical protein